VTIPLQELTVSEPVMKSPLITEPKVHCRIHKSPPLVPIMSKMNSLHNLLPYFFKISFNISLTSVSNSSRRSTSNRFSHQVCLCISLLPQRAANVYSVHSTNYETTFCEAYFAAPLSLSHSVPNITSTPYFQTPLMYAPA
jgi:hypothetical protein